MQLKLKTFVFYGFIALVLTASSAYADMKNGIYIGAGTGVAFANDSDTTIPAKAIQVRYPQSLQLVFGSMFL